MCQTKSGVAIYLNDAEVEVKTLRGEDSHTKIREAFKIRDDDGPGAGRQVPVEYVPGDGADIRKPGPGWKFLIDCDRPEWWTDAHTESAISQLSAAWIAEWDGNKLIYGGLDLRSLTAIPEGVTLSAGRNLDLRSLTAIPEGVTLSAGGDLYLGSLTAIPEGVTLSAGGYLDLNALTAIPEGVTLSAGRNLYLNALTAIPEGVNVKAKRIIFKH
jgi:hypothetical protein